MKQHILAGFVSYCLCGSLAVTISMLGCAPYSSAPERLAKPKKKRRPPGAPDPTAIAIDDQCKADFFKSATNNRNPGSGTRLAQDGGRLLSKAESQTGHKRVSLVKDALSKLRSALRKDPYGSEATYAMAAAYALIGKKGCSLLLLKRLASLTGHPDSAVVDSAQRTVQRATQDQTFDDFRKEADTALGE